MDDSRSETSSSITNLKEKAALGAAPGAGVTKIKRNNGSTTNGASKSSAAQGTVNGSAPADAAQHLPKVRYSSINASSL